MNVTAEEMLEAMIYIVESKKKGGFDEVKNFRIS
jgi:hypothetical protein